MKKNCWLFLGVMLATTAVAQVNTNKLPEIPAPVVAAKPALAPVPAAPAALPSIAPEKAAPDVATKTNAPAKKAVVKQHKKKVVAKVVEKSAVKKTAVAEAPTTLVAGPAIVSTDHVNYRGQAGVKGEVVGHLKKGDTVTVISEINLDKHAAGEPAQWAKIALPSGTKAWVNAKFIDATTKTVSAKKLNLRGGPGENYSVLGAIEKGTIINEITNKGDWKQIEAPTNAFAFVAASYLRQEVPVTTPVTPVVEPVPATTNTVAEAQPIITQPTTIPAAPVTTVPPAMVPNVPVSPVVPTVPTVVVPVVSTNDVSDEDDTNLPPRIVTHEGTVRRSVSPVAPTSYELYSPLTDKAINYLFTSSTNLNLGRYNGMTITVTGEEGLEARWRDTPVLTIQKIYVLPGNAKTDKTAASQQ
jgi:uncharacterized protein YgiM (DUF1202 family)